MSAMAASTRRHRRDAGIAARTRDIDGLRLLAGVSGVESASDAIRICAEFYKQMESGEAVGAADCPSMQRRPDHQIQLKL
jgi:hypothetical protein